MILADTNVWSELTRHPGDPRVIDWLHEHREQLMLSTIVIGEIRFGIGITRSQRKRQLLAAWLNRLIERHRERILPFDLPSSLRFGDVLAELQLTGRHAGYADAQLAAQALAHGHAIATRNVRHFEPAGVSLIDPWGP